MYVDLFIVLNVFLKIYDENRGLFICPQCRYKIDKREEYNALELNFLNSIHTSLFIANMLCHPPNCL